ncbi:MAG: collagen-like protein [Gammaproteobacteria bacterium]|nr:collagen-like protein [Gammaproteobacteria bacterium]MBU1491378.1 collagen-like protein [Gammaproteobacteria bacterium]MBU2064785.1 collagen-like protein [Gammaproteobacteria bacterium]MBU2139331.1 collagen-like protein [Gammaproteobacteria bacterium]MBU2218696.1 collagen-like protein [Gammaproteobacteria bacterium]
MRKFLLLAWFTSAAALAQNDLHVDEHSMLRLPVSSQTLVLERLVVADHGTLLIPAGVTELQIGELRLGREARISVAPGEQALRLHVRQGEIAEGARLVARGAPGTAQRAASAGRTLHLRLEEVVTETLVVDVRGGRGAPGYDGLAGADGKPGGCVLGQASHGFDGRDGTDGLYGAPGGQVRLEVPHAFPIERIDVRVEGGEGGAPGQAGDAGEGGAARGCWLYSTEGGRDGRAGTVGQPGRAGVPGAVDVIRF